MTEHAMLDLVPFARARRKVADRNPQPKLIGQGLQFDFPQPRAAAIAPARVSCHQQFSRPRVEDPAHLGPPASDRLHRKLWRILINPDPDPTFVAGQIINPIWNPFAQLLVCEIMDADLERVPFGAPLLPWLLEIANQFFLFRIDRNDRLAAFLKSQDFLIDLLKLRITIRMVCSLFGLAIGLQAIAHLMQQTVDGIVADSMPLSCQFRRQMASTFRRPFQRRLRVTQRRRGKQLFQVALQTAVSFAQRLAPSTSLPHTGRLARAIDDLWRLLNIL